MFDLVLPFDGNGRNFAMPPPGLQQIMQNMHRLFAENEENGRKVPKKYIRIINANPATDYLLIRLALFSVVVFSSKGEQKPNEKRASL